MYGTIDGRPYNGDVLNSECSNREVLLHVLCVLIIAIALILVQLPLVACRAAP